MEPRDAFISYVQEDTGFARRLADRLQALGYTTWTYEDDGLPGISYLSQVDEAIDACRVFILIASEHSIIAHQVIREVEQAHERQKMIVPVRLDITHPVFAAANPVLRMAVGTSVSLSASATDVARTAERLAVTINYSAGGPAPSPASRQRRGAARRGPTSQTPSVRPASARPAAKAPDVHEWIAVPWCHNDGAESVTPNDVLERVPGAVPWHGSHFDDGSTELVRVPELQLARRTFHAEYYFLDGVLTRYRLELEDKRDFMAEYSVYSTLAGLLRTRYGRPAEESGVKPGAVSASFNAYMKWSADGASIMLAIMSTGTLLSFFVSFETE